MATYLWRYQTPVGFDDLFMNSDGQVLTGLWFEGSRDEQKHQKTCEEKALPIFDQTVHWLDDYFAGNPPKELPALRFPGLTPFRNEVMELMKAIPYGETTTYGALAQILAQQKGILKMSSRAVGGAVGWNPICILIPCHRVIGSDGSLTGYGGGLKNKKLLLKWEGIAT